MYLSEFTWCQKLPDFTLVLDLTFIIDQLINDQLTSEYPADLDLHCFQNEI